MYNDFYNRPPPRSRGKKTYGEKPRPKVRPPNLLLRVFGRLWYVYPAVIMTVGVPPRECLKTLVLAAKPGVDRLHLRNLFTDGRRYFLDPRADGFWLTSNSKVSWRRSRTSVAAVLHGEFSDAGNGSTRILVRARMRLLYLLEAFFIPAFVTSILIFAPWPHWLIVALALVLFGLSWLSHRLTATLQAAEMVYFIERALEDIAPVEIPVLAATAETIITPDVEFRQQWEKFYQEHKGEQDAEE